MELWRQFLCHTKGKVKAPANLIWELYKDFIKLYLNYTKSSGAHHIELKRLFLLLSDETIKMLIQYVFIQNKFLLL